MKRTKIKYIFIPIVLFSLFLFYGADGKDGKTPENAGGKDMILVKNIDYFSVLGISKPKSEFDAVDFSTESLDGQKVALSDFRGKVVFLNFWATWCDPCKAEVKDIDTLWDTLKDEDFALMAVDLREDKRKIKSVMKQRGIDFPVYLDPRGKIASSYRIGGIPTTFIINPDGKVVGRAVGPRDWGSKESIEFMRSLMN